MPSEITSSVPKITNLGFKKMMIENYKNILEYQDLFIRINTSIGIININGIGMKMEEMTKDDIIIEGEIDSIDFEKIEDQEVLNLYLQKIQTTITGYVNIIVEGYYIEKFINICRNNRIYLENLKREKTTIINANIPLRDFKSAAKIAKNNNCKIKIIEKKGLPFFLNKYRKRKIFVISLLVMLLSLIALSKFIWNIEITGNVNISNDEILEIVKSEGLEIGKLKNKIDAKKVVEKIRLERADVSWVGIKISGTNAIIEIVESDKAPEVIDKDDYCNIVAKKDAMVVSANAQNGTLQVKEGDVIKKRKYTNFWMARGKIYRNQICSCYRRGNCKSLVYRKRKNLL